MRKIIFSIPITLDGYIQGPHRELDWVVADDELHDFASDLLQTADLLLYGRVTYELMVNYWPDATSDPNATDSMKRFANTVNPKRKIVYSKTLNQAGWNTQVVGALKPKDIYAMKFQSGGNILLSGGATLASTFFQLGLVDEYQPIIQPVAIGDGKRVFTDLTKNIKLDYQWSRPFRSGAVAFCYHIDPSG
jgi:dihydrofolate reductase